VGCKFAEAYSKSCGSAGQREIQQAQVAEERRTARWLSALSGKTKGKFNRAKNKEIIGNKTRSQ
jgi:hypothetical protein